MADENVKRCAFCSATDRKDLIFYQGLLSPLICSDCVRGIMLLVLDRTVSRMEFKRPETVHGKNEL